MAQASRDQNFVPTLLGVSSVDGTTPVAVYANPTTHRILVDLSGGGSGTVTDVSVVSANGFAGTVATSTTTPAITLSTTITGILSGNGTAISAASTTGSGAVVLQGTPTLTTPVIGAATGTSLQLSGLTASEILITDASKNLVSAAVATYPSLTELTYLKGVTSAIQTQINAKGAGTVTAIGVTTANGVSGSSSGGATPNLTITLGAITPTTVNGNTFTTGTYTITGTAAKTLTFTNSITLSGTDSTTMTFPTTSKTLAANDGSNWTFASQAIGDIVYASSTTAFTRLAAVAVGSVLVSAGTGTAPAYSATPLVTSIDIGATDTTISKSAAGVIAVEGVVIPSISSTNTLTNKRITRRVTTTNAPGATPTTNTDNVDVMNFTGLNAAITSMTTNLSGTPVDGDLIMFRFTDDGTARAITWGASFAATTIALPTTTVISTMLRVGFQYSGSTWKCIATC